MEITTTPQITLIDFCWTNFHFGEKAKAMRRQPITSILLSIFFRF